MVCIISVVNNVTFHTSPVKNEVINNAKEMIRNGASATIINSRLLVTNLSAMAKK